MKKIPFLLLAAMLLLSCGSLPFQPTPTATFTPSPTGTPTLTPTATIVPPQAPEAGYSNVYGRVLFRGLPVEGMDISLENASARQGPEYYGETVTTDDQGRFVFPRVPPGNDFQMWASLYSTALWGEAGAIRVTLSVPSEANFNYGEYYLVETDLLLLTPERDAVLPDSPALLTWEPYPGAAYYYVELHQGTASYTDQEWETDQTYVALEAPLFRCIYGWDVTAYDADGIPLARSDRYVDENPSYSSFFQKMYDGYFRIENDDLYPCYIEVYSPLHNATIARGRVEFRWALHPLAVRYVLSMSRTYGNIAAGEDVVTIPRFFYEEFLVQEDGSLAGPSLPSFERGSYIWSVWAYAENGAMLAETGVRIFRIP